MSILKKIKQKKCKICKEPYTPYNSMQKCCTKYDCIKEIVKLENIKKLKKEARDLNVWRAKENQKLMTLSDWKKILQTHINHLVRIIDYGQPCIATGARTGKMNAGHYVSIGSNATLRYHLDNIHIQSEHSNSWKSGDTIRYQDGIRSTYGEAYLFYMDSLKGLPPLHLTVDEIKEAIKKVKNIIKEMPPETVYTTTARRHYRSLCNKTIGIYG